MKLTFALLTAAFLNVSASGLSQTVSFSGKDVPLKNVLSEVERQTGFAVMYTDNALTGTRPVSVKARNIPLESFIQLVLKDQPLKYIIENKTILLSRKPPAIAPAEGLSPRPEAAGPPLSGPVRGRALDNGAPLSGATVSVKGSGHSTVTGADGLFQLNVREGDIIVVSFVGHQAKEIRVSASMINSGNTGDIDLPLAHSKLDEVQVIAYGETSQRMNTGSVSVVSGREIEEQPVSNPLLALQGRAPGLFITQASGVPGSGVTVQIRGQNSINSGNDPLYVIDGVPYPSLLLSNQGFVLGSSGSGNTNTQSMYGNPLSYLNPGDIESISVLKDAGSTAIYGSRGANGVILITTKKGKAGQTRVDINAQSGIGQVAHKAKLLNTRQYLDMRREALKNDGMTPSLLNGDYDLLQWDTTRYTDWQKELIGNTAHYTDVEGSVSGGNEFTQFLIGGGYNRQTSVFPGNYADQKASLHFNINHASLNRKFTVALTGNYTNDNNKLPQADLTNDAFSLAPDAPPVYNADGSINWALNSAGSSTFQNPLADNLNTWQSKTNNLVANAVLGYTILPGLNIRTSLGYTNLQSNDEMLLPLSSTPPQYLAFSQRYASFINNNINSWIVEPQVNYKKAIAGGKLEVLIGATIQQNNSKGQQVQAMGQNSDLVLDDLGAATSVSGSTISTIYKYNALFGRLNYSWEDKYLVDLTARRDGSSRFGSANEFHNFGAVGLGWIFTKEAFFIDHLPFLSFGKLRGSYGSTGNDKIGDYQFLSTYSSIYVSSAYQNATGMAPTNLPSPNIQWELTKKLEFGLETGFLKDRILLAASYSRNRSSNQLLAYALPITTGFTSITSNFPAVVRNTSWEFSVSTINVKGASFSWSSNFNLTVPRNELVAFPNLATSTYANRLVIGQPISIQKVYHLTGVDPATGVYQFASKTNPSNPVYTVDNNTVINTLPRFYAGFQNSIGYKSFKLDFLFQYVKQTARNVLFVEQIPGSAGHPQFVNVLARWQQPDQITNIQRFSSNNSTFSQYNAARSSDAAYSDASFLRLRNVSLSWQVKESLLNTLHMKQIRIYVQAQNLLTVTHYQGLDPETASISSLPPLRVITAGIQVGL